MQKLASTMIDHLDALTEEYARRLQDIGGYADLSEQDRLERARRSLKRIVMCLRTGNIADFTAFVRDDADKRLREGFTSDYLLKALTALESTILPLVDEVETAKFLWRALAQARGIASQRVIDDLRASEHRFRQIVDRSPVGIFRTTSDGTIIEANPAFMRIVGYESLKAINRVGVPSLYEDPADREKLLAALERGTVADYETRFQQPDGVVIPVSITVRTISDGDGKSHFLDGIIEDITERKEAEEALRDAELEKATILDSVSEHVIYQDLEHRILWPNRAACESVDATREELTGRYCYEVWAGRDDRCPYCPVAEAVAAGRPQQIEKKTPDGRAWFIRGYPVRDADGNITGGIEVTQEITARKEAQEALRESEMLFRSVVENAPTGIFIVDENYQFVYGNDELSRILGYTPEEIIGMDFRQVLDEESKQIVADRYLRRQRGEEIPSRYELSVIRKDGEKRRLEMSAVLIQHSAGNPRTVAQVMDITERKQAQRKLAELLEHRGQQVQLTTEIAQDIATAPALEKIYERVVTLVKERFGYYHVQIFRYDPGIDAMRVVEGYGDVGESMKAARHSLPYGEGVVGAAAARGEPVLASDVTEDPYWRPHPDLPKTEGELAVPIKLRDAVLGVLDVQSDKAGALTEEDQVVLLGLAGQIASAIQSTRLREGMEENLRELERLTRTMSREGWKDFRHEVESVGYMFNRSNVIPADDIWVPEMERLGEQEAFIPPTSDDGATAVAPLSIRGEIIGALGVQTDPQQPLSSEDLMLVESVSEQVALALESTRLFEQTQAARAEAETLYDVTRSLMSAGESEEMLEAIAGPAFEAGATTATLAYVESDDEGQPDWAVGVARKGVVTEQAPPLGERYRLSDSPMGQLLIAEPDYPHLIADIHEAMEQQVPQAITGAMVLIPLRLGGRWVGLVTLSWPEPHTFSEYERRLYEAVGPQLATSIENRRLFERTQEALEKLEATNRLYLRERWEKFVPSRAAPFYERARGDLPSLADTLPPSVERAMAQQELVTQQSEDGEGELIAPLTLRGEVIGALGLQRHHGAAPDDARKPKEDRQWSDEEMALIESVAEQLALAVESARLLEETQRRAQRDRLVADITAKVRASSDVETIMRTAVRELGAALDTDRARVQLGAAGTKTSSSKETGDN